MEGGKWAGDDTQRSDYINEFNLTNVATDKSIYAASGLYKNFKQIIFSKGTSAGKEQGYFTKVNGKEEGELGENEFIIDGKATEVHNLTLKELNRARYNNTENDTSTVSVADKDNDGLFNLGKNYFLAYPFEGYDRFLSYIAANRNA